MSAPSVYHLENAGEPGVVSLHYTRIQSGIPDGFESLTPVTGTELRKLSRLQTAGPLGSIDLSQKYQFPNDGERRTWMVGEAAIAVHECYCDSVTSDARRRPTIILQDTLGSTVCLLQPPRLVPHSIMSASPVANIVTYDVDQIHRAVEGKNQIEYAHIIIGLIHEQMHVEDGENQKIDQLLSDLTKAVYSPENSQEEIRRMELLGMITLKEIGILATLLNGFNRNAKFAVNKGMSIRQQTEHEVLLDHAVQIMAERRNMAATVAFIKKAFGSLEHFDLLTGNERGTALKIQEMDVETRKTVYLNADRYTEAHTRVIKRAIEMGAASPNIFSAPVYPIESSRPVSIVS